MFKQLRLKLTMVNITVVGLIMIFILLGIYILMQKDMEGQSYRMMRNIAMDEIFHKRKPPGPPTNKKFSNYIFVKMNSNGEILETASNTEIDQDQSQLLVKNAQALTTDRGYIKASGEAYRFMKMPLINDQGFAIIFLDTQHERDTITRLLTVSAIVGLISIGLVFFCSLFLADRALIPINEAWEKQRAFIADASHELRTPLAVIQTNLELVLGNGQETVESQSKWLNNILNENKRMTKLVEDMLLLARIDSRQETLDMENFSVNKTISEAVSLFEPIGEKKRIVINQHIDVINEFRGDSSRIKQLLIILLDNAIKYTNSGGIIEVACFNKDSCIEILVSDTGEGISEENQKKVFERFYRIDKSRSRDNGGTGLGLSIAHWIVKEHQGNISIKSAPGKGTSFKVELPKR